MSNQLINERELADIIKDLQLISSNKLNTYQSKIFFIGITIDLLLNTKLFEKNIDLKPFIEKHYINILDDKSVEPFKEYLYACRTPLAARLSRLIYEKMDYSTILKSSSEILKELPQDITKKTTTKKDDALDEWMGYLSDKGNK